MLKNLVVALDGSPCAERALDVALDLARIAGSRLAICCVVDPSPLYGTLEPAVLIENTLEEIRSEAEHVVSTAIEKAHAAGVSAEGCTPGGEPVHEIGAYADRIHADGIVIGTHGRSGVRRLFMGSIAEGVMRQATVPVVTVRQDVRVGGLQPQAVS